jgi:hypothetical protein
MSFLAVNRIDLPHFSSRPCQEIAANAPGPTTPALPTSPAGSIQNRVESMILFQNIIHMWRRPASAPPSQISGLLQFVNRRPIRGMAVRVNHPGTDFPGVLQRQLQELLGSHQISLRYCLPHPAIVR